MQVIPLKNESDIWKFCTTPIFWFWVLIFVGDGVIGHTNLKLLSKARGLVRTGYAIFLEKKAAQSSTDLKIDFFS